MKKPKNVSNNKTNTDRTNEGNTNSINQNEPESYSAINQPKSAKKKRVFSQRQISSNDSTKTINVQNNKKYSKNTVNDIDSKLSPSNYVKPLYYTLYSQIRPVNKQYFGYRYDRNFLYIPYPNTDNKNNNITYKNKINEKNEEKKENNTSNNKRKKTNHKMKPNSRNNDNLKNKNNKKFGNKKMKMI